MERNQLKQERTEDVEYDSEEEGYYLRRKRLKLMVEAAGQSASSPYVHKRTYRRKNPIMHMPTEVLEKIFAYVSNEDLARTVRLVNHRFRTIGQFILNSNFKRLKEKIAVLQKMVVDSLQHTQDDMETRCMCKMLSTLELLNFYHSIIRSTLWRYIYFQHSSSNLCMYAGSILDMYNVVLRQFVTEPYKIYSPAILRDYALSKDVKAICNNAKVFALYFDRISELPNNNNTFCTGSKILDILDCATDATRNIVSQKLTGNTVLVKLRYYFTNTWFVALDIPEEKPKMWSEEQRLMYMRLRRIVVSHSEMTMEYNQFKREIAIRTNPASRVRRPINSVYTGYGEVGSKFFYYGVMNEGAYFNKFETDDIDVQEIFLEVPEQMSDQVKTPFLGLDVSVELRCPLQLAPNKIIEAYKKHIDGVQERTIMIPNRRVRGTFDLKIDFDCHAATYPRLPTSYSYHLRDQR